VSRRLDA